MRAPDFTLEDQNGAPHSLGNYAGNWLVLYFYIKDDTSGCTMQACDLRDEHDDLESMGNVKVVGISEDSVESHRKFAEKYGLNFSILSDPDHAVIQKYGAWNDIKGTLRNTYIIDPDGTIVKSYEDVNPMTHAADIVRDLKTLQAAH